MVTLEQIRNFAIEKNACVESIMPFCYFLKEGNELECWRIVLEYIEWLEIRGLKLPYKTVHKNAEGMAKRYHDIYDKDFTVPRICRSIERDKNGKLHGKFMEYDYNGKLKLINEYKNGERILSVFYHDNSDIISSINKYKNGKKHGQHLYYHPNGVISAIINHKDGKQHGTFEHYYDTDVIQCRGKCSNDILDGIYYSYFTDGKIKEKILYDKHRIKRYYRYENGKVVERMIHEGEITLTKLSGSI